MARYPEDYARRPELGLFGKFNILCIRLLLWAESRIAALFVLFIIGLLVAATLGTIYGDDRTCLRRAAPIYVQAGSTMTPIEGKCLEYAE